MTDQRSVLHAYLGLLLGLLRRRAGISMEALARRLGIEAETVQELEGGSRPFTGSWLCLADQAVGAGGLLAAAQHLLHPLPSMPAYAHPSAAVTRGGAKPGEEVYDPATGRAGILTAVYDLRDLFAAHGRPSARIAFLRPYDSDHEIWADAELLHCPPKRIDFRACVLCGRQVRTEEVMVGVIGRDPAQGWTGWAHRLCAGDRDLGGIDLDDMTELITGAQVRAAAREERP